MNSAADDPRDWRDAVLSGASELPSSPTVRCVIATIGGHQAVVAAWSFARQGGSFGVADASAFVAAVDTACVRGLPLVTMLRSGGTRLPEGIRALVGIPRTTLALQRLRAAGLVHVTVADHPTTGGVWVAIGSRADIRIAIANALVGFSGPRAIAAMTGKELSSGANRAASAYQAGLVDLVVEASSVGPMVARILSTVAGGIAEPVTVGQTSVPAAVDPWTQVQRSRQAPRPDGSAMLTDLLADAVALHAADDTVLARIGLLAGRTVVAVALSAARGGMPTATGFGLLTRAAELADALDLALVCLIDTPGADPHTESLGLAAGIAASMAAVLATRPPTVALVHGEGGSGGALAGAVTDVVGVGTYGWFAALGPEGAAATLRIDPQEAARQMAITPADLLADGFADDFVPIGAERAWLATTIDRLREEPPERRREARIRRWSAPLPPRD